MTYANIHHGALLVAFLAVFAGALLILPPAAGAAIFRDGGSETLEGGGGGGIGGGGGAPATQCNDGLDNDGNGYADYPADLGCSSVSDATEAGYAPSTQCSDGLDNDGNGLIDLNDPGCSSAADTAESGYVTQCSDGLDNDGNGRTDYPNDPGCSSRADTSEAGWTQPPAPPSGVIVYQTQAKRDYYVKTYPDMAANGGLGQYTAAHGYPAYQPNQVSPTGTRICQLYDPSAYITEWTLGGFDTPNNNSMAAWNPSTGRWYAGMANSFGNKRYNYLTCKTNEAPDTSLVGTALGASGTSLAVPAGTPVTLTWLSRYGQVRKGTMSAENFGLTTTVPGHFETVTEFVCGYDDGGVREDGGVNLYRLASAPGRNLTAAVGSSCLITTSFWVPETTVSRPFGGSTVVTPAQTTTYRYRGTNANGTNSASVTVTVIPAELPACADGLDNDNDGLVDLADPGCSGPEDTTEENEVPACADGIDNDGDGLIDLADPGCSGPDDLSEVDEVPLTQCSDGLDNDNDGLIDLADPDCSGPTDSTENPGIPLATLANNGPVPSGGSATLTYACTNSTSATLSTFGSLTPVSGGTRTTPALTQNANYQLTCTGPGGSASATTVVAVNVPTASITAAPDRVRAANPTSLTWNIQNCQTPQVTGGNGFSSTAPTGTNVSSGPLATQTTFTASCPGTPATASVIVNVVPGFEEF